MKTWRKELSLLLVGMMIMTGLVAISAPASAEFVVKEDMLELEFDNRWMVEDAPTPYTERTYFAEARWGGWNLYRVGEADNLLRVRINVLSNDVTDLFINLTGAGTSGSFSFHDELPASRSFGTPGAGSIVQCDWMFDTLITDFLGHGERTRIDLRYSYWDPSAAPPTTRAAAFSVYISLSSLFQVGATQDTTPLPDLVKNDGYDSDGLFEAGDMFADTVLNIENNGGDETEDLWVTLTPPAGITLAGADATGKAKAWLPNGVGPFSSEDTFFRSNIDSRLKPGRHVGSAVIQYTRLDSGLTVTEPAHEVVWPVNFNFRNTDPGKGVEYSFEQCYASEVVIVEDGTRQVDYVAPYTPIPSIEQSTYTDRKIKVNVTVVNNGNHPLYNVEFQIDPDAPDAWNNFRNPRFFWPNIYTNDPEYDTISRTIDYLDVGDEVVFTIEMIVASNVPIGEHRLPILYRGYYFNDGSLEEATGFFATNNGDDLVVLFSIRVDDSVIQCVVTQVTADQGDKGQIVVEEINVVIANLEGYTFIDITVRANFTGTPWYNPVIGMRSPYVWAEEANPYNLYPEWTPSSQTDPTNLSLSFVVDTDPSFVPDRYPFSMEVTAVIRETLAVVTLVVDYNHGAVLDFTGYGPRMHISAFTTDDIIPGQLFDMTVNISNVGDDTLRDVMVIIDTDGTDPMDWFLLCDFIGQIQRVNETHNYWEGEKFSWQYHDSGWYYEEYDGWWDYYWEGDFYSDGEYGFTDDEGTQSNQWVGAQVTLEQLDIDSARELIELNLYMDGVYSRPSARISLIRIIDLAPGASFSVEYQMYADKDMVNGKPYEISVFVSGIDSWGDTYYEVFDISVMSSLPGKSYNPVELNWFDAGLKALALLLFFIIVLAILLFVYNMFKGDSYDDEEDFDFEDNESFEQTPPPAPPAEQPQQELVEP